MASMRPGWEERHRNRTGFHWKSLETIHLNQIANMQVQDWGEPVHSLVCID